MYNFTYTRATSVEDAVNALSQDEDAKILAGGMTLIPTLKQRLAAPSQIIDLSGLDGLKSIKIAENHIEIGALTRHADVAAHDRLQDALPALAALAGHIGDPQVRNRGTLGGSLANNDPAADYPAAVLGLGATIVTNAREIAADDFFKGLFETALAVDEIITSVRFPIPRRAAYMKFPNPASRYAIVGAFVADMGNGIRVAITGAGPSVFRWGEAEDALGKSFTAQSLEGLKVDASDMNSDLHASAEYRAHLVGVMTRRAVLAITG